MARDPINGTVVEIHEDQLHADEFSGKRTIYRGAIVVETQEGERMSFFRGTGQISDDAKIGDGGLVEWIHCPTACYPTFSRRD